MRRVLLFTILAISIYTSKSQTLSFNCPRDTILGCNTTCFTLTSRFPDVKSLADDYTFKNVTAASVCRPYVDPGTPGPSTNIVADDKYSDVIDLPFNFPFYGTLYNQLVISTNGYVSFDISRATLHSHYEILNNGGALSPTSGSGYPGENLPSALYDKALIMGPYHDIDPFYTTSPTMQITYYVDGTAPNRRWILSFYRVPLFLTACQNLIENTHEIVLYESTGVVEVYIKDMEICTGWNDGKAMVGLQDFTRTKGIMAPGRRASDPAWGSIGMNETWRFIPSQGPTLYRKVELLNAAGAVVATGDTTRIDANTFETSFANVCPPPGTSLWVIKTTYQKIDDPAPGAEIFSLDTINVIRTPALPIVDIPAPTACGATTGSITINANGGVAPYTYTLTGPGGPYAPVTIPANNTVFSNLGAGAYHIHVVDGAGCMGDKDTTVLNIPTLTGTFIPTGATCPGINNGSLVITPDIGPSAGPYTFTLTGPGGPYVQNGVVNTATFSGLTGGTYAVTFANAAGCSGTITGMIVGAGSTPTATITKINTSCPGAVDGVVTVTLGSGAGTGPFNVTLNPVGTVQTGVSSPVVFSGLPAGTYTATFTNAAGCTNTTSSVTIVNGTTPSAAITHVNTSCPGVTNGTVTVTPNGGVTQGPYNITLNPGGLVQNGVATSATFTGLATGTYTATFTNAAGCNGTSGNTTIGNGTTPSGIISGGTTTCPGVNDGTVTVTPNGGAAQGPYDVTLNPGGIVMSGVATAAVFTGLATGNYTATFVNAAGCTGTVVGSANVSSGPAPTATIVPTNTSCPGVNDGTITVTPAGGAGAGPYDIQLYLGAVLISTQTGVATAAVFTGLAAATGYNAAFVTALGCTGTTASVNILVGPAPTAAILPTNTSCPGINDGTVTITPDGGAAAGPYNITLNPGAIVQTGVATAATFTGLAPGSYTATFTTAAGCIGTTANGTVLAGPFLTSGFTQFDPPCANINDGSITIIPGATSALPITSFTLNTTTQTTATFTNLAPGTYNYTYIDASGCTGSGGPIVLTTHSPITTTVTLTKPLCNGNANGIIELNASGGVASYQYALSPFTSYQATGTFNNLLAGTYTFRIKDNVGCTKDTTVTLTEPLLLTATASNPGIASCSGNDGTILVVAFDGTPSYQYSIDNGVTYQATGTFTAPHTGLFPDIKVKDANGCIASASTTVNYVDAMFLTVGPDTTICVGSSVKFQPITNPGTSIYKWRPLDPLVTSPTTIDNDNLENATVTPLDTATYVLNAKWGPCFREDTITVNVLHKPVPYAGEDTAICQHTYAIIHGSATNLSGTVNYVWTPGATLQDDSTAITVATPDSTQTYTLTVTDNYGCKFSVTDDIKVTVQPPVPAYAGNDTLAILGAPHQLFGSGGVSYLWSPAAPLDFSTAQNPLATLYNDQKFILQVTDIAGCIGYDTVFIKVYQGPAYYVPNAFSPNGDGVNETFRAIPVGMAKTDYFRVFNRYGELVFETKQWLKGWDGRYKGKIQPTGAYVWVVKGTDKFGNNVEERGTVLLIQ